MILSQEREIQAKLFKVGDLTVDLVRREVRREDDVLPVKGLSFELLACLIRHYPGLATMRQINDEVWGQNVVSTAALSQRVKLLREGLGQSATHEQYIEVVKSRGYQLVVPVEAQQTKDLSESLVSTVARNRPLNSRLLILIGTVLLVGLAAWVMLLVRPDQIDWNTDAATEVKDLNSVGGEQISDGEPGAATLAAQLNVSEEAYDLYQRGLYHGRTYSKPEIQKGIQLLNRALELEPEFASALGARAMLYAWAGTPSYGWMSPEVAYQKAREDALHAIALDPTLDWVSVVIGDILLWHEWNVDAAESAYRTALLNNPQSSGAMFSLGLLLAVVGREDEAVELVRRGVEIQPLEAGSYTNLAWRLINARRYDDAIAAANRALELEPGMDDAITIKIWAYTYLEQYEQAIELVDQTNSRATQGYALARSGYTDSARQILEELISQPEGGEILADEVATLYIGLGDYEAALDWLEKAYQERSRAMLFLNMTAVYDPLRNNPRFQSLLERVGVWNSQPDSSISH